MPYPDALVAENVRDDRYALYAVIGEAFFHLFDVVRADVPCADQLDSFHMRDLNRLRQHFEGRRIVFVTFAETVAGIAQVA